MRLKKKELLWEEFVLIHLWELFWTRVNVLEKVNGLITLYWKTKTEEGVLFINRLLMQQCQSCVFMLFLPALLFSSCPDGLAAFRTFLKTEFSDENIEFWMACEDYKKIKSSAKLVSKANKIFKEFIDVQAPREVV